MSCSLARALGKGAKKKITQVGRDPAEWKKTKN